MTKTLSVARGIQIPDLTRRSFELRPLGLKVLKRPTQEEWEALGDFLSKMHGALSWVIGDWILCGEDAFGELAAQAVDATGWEYETVQQYTRVCKAVPYATRQPGLSFSHHREVADLKEAQQLKWLAKAKDEGWSSARLRRELNKNKNGEAAKLWVLAECKDPEDQEELLGRLQGEGRACKAVER